MLIVKVENLNDAVIDYSVLSPQVIEQAENLTGKRKTQFLVCRSLLAMILKTYFSIPILPQMTIGNNSRPHFIDATLPDFNISHSQDTVAVAVASNQRVGLDIEISRERKNYQNVAKQFFSSDENAWLLSQTEPLDAFWQLWTLKESALKLYSKGVWQMKSVKTDLENKLISAPFADLFHFQYHHVGPVHIAINSDKPINDLVLLAHAN